MRPIEVVFVVETVLVVGPSTCTLITVGLIGKKLLVICPLIVTLSYLHISQFVNLYPLVSIPGSGPWRMPSNTNSNNGRLGDSFPFQYKKLKLQIQIQFQIMEGWGTLSPSNISSPGREISYVGVPYIGGFQDLFYIDDKSSYFQKSFFFYMSRCHDRSPV